MKRNPRSDSTAQPRTIVITGVSRGLGRAMAEAFIRLGHVVIGCGRSEASVKELQFAHGAPHRFDVVDVTDDVSVRDWAADALCTNAVPDLLINNAAVINRNTPLWKVTAKDFGDLIDTNVKGVANVIRHWVPAMVKQGSGVIVNFSSGWGRAAGANVAPYCASKWAIEGLTRALAMELPKGMAAVPLSPGIIDTDMLRTSFGDEASQYPSAREWAKGAVPFILGIDAADNGKPLTVP